MRGQRVSGGLKCGRSGRAISATDCNGGKREWRGGGGERTGWARGNTGTVGNERLAARSSGGGETGPREARLGRVAAELRAMVAYVSCVIV